MTIHSTILAAENTIETGNPILNIAIFVIFIVATMTIVVRATRQTSQKGSDFYTGGASFSGWQNGLAIAGDYLSAAAFLGVTGAIALYGYDALPSRCVTPGNSPWPMCCHSASSSDLCAQPPRCPR